MVFEEFERNTGKVPEALQNKPPMPWYYTRIFSLYSKLSDRRSVIPVVTSKVFKKQLLPETKLVPAPIDSTPILLLAMSTGIMKPEDFLDVVSELDRIYLNYHRENNAR